MSYGKQAARYREMEVMSATPGQLVVLLYDHLLVSLRRARMAIEAGEIERRLELLDRSRAVVGELLSTLDFEQGGDLANRLRSLYAFLYCELLDQSTRPDTARLDRLTRIVDELRDAWATVAAQSVAERPLAAANA
jgi:flagellar protein FliS